ncbi:MAG: TolC family protein [Elusimicrobiaceae bacterium]
MLVLPAHAAIVSDTITWEDCVDYALSANPSLAGSRSARESSGYDYKAELNDYYPQFGLGYSVNRSGNGSAYTNWGLNLSATELLFSAKTNSAVRLKRSAMEKADAQLLSASAGARNDLRAAFINVLYAKENIDVSSDIYKLRKSNAEMIRLRYEGGRESKGNMMRAQALAEASYYEISSARRELETMRRSLSASLGMDDFRSFTASGSLADFTPPPPLDINASAWSNPDVQIGKVSLKIAQEQVVSAGADVYPTLSASQGLGWSGDSALPQDRQWNFGFNLNVPIFSNGPTYVSNKKKSAESLYRQSEETYRQTLFTSKTNLQTAQARLENAHDAVRSAAVLLQAAKQRHIEAQIQYLNGAMDFQIWEGIEQEFINYERSYLTSLREINLAKAALDKLLGVPLAR